ncbi:MAG: hypothetical protein U1E76_20965 [Planctomycetota bacterium]
MSDHTPYQKGIIKRFYEHRDTLAVQKLSEIVSDLYLETSPAKVSRAWSNAFAQLRAAGVPEATATKITLARDLDGLARIVGKLA